MFDTAGSVRIENAWGDDPQNVRTATRLEVVDTQGNRETELVPPTDQFWLQLRHMQDCMANGIPHRIPPADSIAQMRDVDAVCDSLKTGTPVHAVDA